MFTWLKKKSPQDRKKEQKMELPNIVQVDMHSHLLYGIDDGARTIENTLELAQKFVEMGYKKMILTPHVMLDGYKNTPEIILNRLADVQKALEENNIELEIQAAAEYYLDEGFWKKIRNNEPLLSFGKEKYVLFESGFRNKPQNMKELVFEMQILGYKPVWAHPERYYYLHNDNDLLDDMISRGVLLQINQVSLVNFYGEECRKYAEFLVEQKYVNFIGSDCHSLRYTMAMQDLKKQKIYQKLSELNLLNNSLLENIE